MLRYSFNGKDSELYYIALEVNSLKYSGDNNESILVNAPEHGLYPNDKVRLTRYDQTANLEEFVNLTIVDTDNFLIDSFPPASISYSSMEFEEVKVGFDSDGNVITKHALVIYFDTPHYFIHPKKFNGINEVINDNYYSGEVDPMKKLCVGDTVLYNGFVYPINDGGVGDDHRYHFSSDPSDSLNYSKVNLTYYNSDIWRELTIEGGFVPVNEDGTEDRSRLIFFYDDGKSDGNLVGSGYTYETLHYIEGHAPDIELIGTDERFFIDNGDGTLSFTKNDDDEPTSFIFKEYGNYHISVPIGETFSTKARKEDALSQLAARIGEENTSKIVDYEKRVFEPVFYKGNDFAAFADDDFDKVNEIVFNLHFRSRHDKTNSEDETVSEWVSDEADGWNNYYILKDNSGYAYLSQKQGLTDNDADLLSYLNFNDPDVYYQRNKVKKSFIRLSFYDSPNRKDQVLQFYSTIFYDSGEAYTKFVDARYKNGEYTYGGVTEEQSVYVNDEHLKKGDSKDMRICARFFARDKYDMQHCSDGFYAYFFPSVIQGTLPSDLYLKVEFNHAKYGRTIPFTLPSYKDGYKIYPIAPNSKDTNLNKRFPIHYMVKDDSSGEYSKVNFERLNKDMYINVKVKYDNKLNRYVWFLPRKNGESVNEERGQIVFNLFEPRINGYEKLPSDTIYDVDPDTFSGDTIIMLKLFNYRTDSPMWFAFSEDGVRQYDVTISANGSLTYQYITYAYNDTITYEFAFYPNGATTDVPITISLINNGGSLVDSSVIGDIVCPRNTTKYHKFTGNVNNISYIKDGKRYIEFEIKWKR